MMGEIFTKYVAYLTGILSINGQMNGTNIFFQKNNLQKVLHLGRNFH